MNLTIIYAIALSGVISFFIIWFIWSTLNHFLKKTRKSPLVTTTAKNEKRFSTATWTINSGLAPKKPNTVENQSLREDRLLNKRFQVLKELK